MLKTVKSEQNIQSCSGEEKKRQRASQKRQLMKRKVILDLKNAIAKKKAAFDDLRGKMTQFDSETHSLQEQLKK